MLLTAKVKTNDQEASPEKKLVDIPPFMMTDITAITMFDCKDGYVGIMDLIPSAENGLVFVS